MRDSYIKLFTALVVVGLVSGCASSDMEDLKRFTRDAHKGLKPRVEPLPKVRPQEAFVYNASQLVDPFSVSNLSRRKPTGRAGTGPSPDLGRRKQALEQYPLDSLRMVGTLIRRETAWVILRAPDGTIHRARTGDYLGQNFGVITKVTEEKIDVKELISGSTGSWIERNTQLAIIE